MNARSLACVLIVGCGSSSPKAPKAPAAETPTTTPTPPAMPTAHRAYPISSGRHGGGTHITTIDADVPTAWHERYDDNSRSPGFELAPNDLIMAITVLELTPAATIRVLFGDAKDLKRTDTGDHTWVVDHQADGGVHAGLMFPAQDAEYSVLCETRLEAKRVNLLDAIEKICGTVKIDHVEDKAPPATDPPKPPPHDQQIKPKKKLPKDIVQPVLIEKQPQ